MIIIKLVYPCFKQYTKKGPDISLLNIKRSLELAGADIECINEPPLSIPDRILNNKFYSIYKKYGTYIKEIGADVIFTFSDSFYLFVKKKIRLDANIVSYLHGAPSLIFKNTPPVAYFSPIHIHRMYHSLLSAYRLRSLDMCDVIFFNSVFTKRYYNVDGTVLYPPVDVNSFSISREHNNKLLLITNDNPLKNAIPFLLSVLNNDRIFVDVYAVGSTRFLSRLYDISKHSRNINFLGMLTKKNKHLVMSRYLAVIIPSKQETYSLVKAEALSAGVPIMAFPGSATLEGTRPGYTGFSIRTIDDISSTIDILEDNAFRKRISKIARRDAIKYFDISSAARTIKKNLLLA